MIFYAKAMPVYKKIDRVNKQSGHEWTEEVGEPIRWEVTTHLGVIAKCKTEEKAIKLAAEWQAFYDKHCNGGEA